MGARAHWFDDENLTSEDNTSTTIPNLEDEEK